MSMSLYPFGGSSLSSEHLSEHFFLLLVLVLNGVFDE